MQSKTSGSKVHKCRGKNQHSARQQPEYWEAKLKRMGLTLEAGRKIGSESITYGHMVRTLDWDGRVTYEPPTGERLDNEEWPISMC